ncbi:MAG: thiamine-phosphate kinase [Candidatus Dormibacteria bacterium]
MTTVGELGELALLARLRPHLSGDGGELVVGVGDDAAVWQPPPGRAVVATTDSMVEGSHFQVPLDTVGAADLGWRLLAASLSDLAAMGAAAGPALISLALPAGWPVAWVDAIYEGISACAERYGAPVAGGNVSASPAAVLTSTCLGTVDARACLRRDGAQPGWQLAVTGPVGAAAAVLQARREGRPPDPAWRAAARPLPRLEAGRALLEAGVRVALDISDGLYLDASRLLEASAVTGLVIEAAALPVATGIRECWPVGWLDIAGGGEDYELLFAAPPPLMARVAPLLAGLGLEAPVIGRFDSGAGMRLLFDGREQAPPRSGFEHLTGA